ncbi:hypothetical protein O1611_g8670 [Lasiodiplodia mahajangana]|uniref:Uncharacterized protein n=1 Tax=Lasiodiplodia mahajangana TaxID=1108764 RepID=A0ACC2JBV4_9PEZI|nr:hypothetical protein O1611_g8670 [Lasiodiplodia mahajangana]
MRRWFFSALLLLQAIALAWAADQKVLATDDVNAQVAKPDSTAQSDLGPTEHHTWNPYQNGKLRQAAGSEIAGECLTDRARMGAR